MANKKISQLAALTVLSADDLLMVVDDPAGTPTTRKAPVSTLDDRYYIRATVDSLLAAKEGSANASIASQYYRGDKTWQTLNSDAVTEGSRLYFTDARVAANTSARHTHSNQAALDLVSGTNTGDQTLNALLPTQKCSATSMTRVAPSVLATPADRRVHYGGAQPVRRAKVMGGRPGERGGLWAWGRHPAVR